MKFELNYQGEENGEKGLTPLVCINETQEENWREPVLANGEVMREQESSR